MSPTLVGDLNRSRVIQVLRDNGPRTRAELAKLAGVTRATMGGIADSLVQAGVLEELDAEPVSGRVGKPGRPLWFSRDAGLSVGVSVRPGIVESALVNLRGEVLSEFRCRVGQDPTNKIVKAVQEVLPSRRGTIGVGIAVPGAVDPATGEVLGSSQFPKLTGTGLASVVHRQTGLAVIVENDSRAQAIAEKWFGEGRGINDFVSVQTGEGLGVGLVLSRVLHRGVNPEFGHARLVVDGERCPCGLRGCWETVATLRWLRAQAERRGLKDPAAVDAGVLAASSDVKSRRLLDDYASGLALGLAAITSMLTPERIILHGDVTAGGEPFRALIEKQTRELVLEHMKPTVEIVFSELDQRAGVLGAASVVMSENFSLSA